MKKRNSDRDTLKLQDWDSYVSKINYTPPYELEKAQAVDRFVIFDTQDTDTYNRSLHAALHMISERSAIQE